MAGNKIQLKRTSVSGRVPSNTDIDVGELAINLADNRLFTKDGANAVIDVHGQSLNTTSNVTFGSVNAVILSTGTITGNLDWSYITSKPDLKIDITGDATGNNTFTDLANGSISVTLANTTVTAGTYGNSSAIPVITVDAKGRITSATTNTVAGITGYSYTSANNTFAITAGDGSTYKATIDTVNNFTVSSNLTTNNANVLSTLSVGGDVTISGNLIVNGNTITVNTSQINVTDSIIYLASNNEVSDTLDIGFAAHYNAGSGANGHTGLIRSAASKKYYLFQNYQPEFLANNSLDYSNTATGIEMADIVVGNLVANSTLTVTGNATFSNSISVTGNATFSNTIAVTGNATFSNNVTITGNLVVTGTTTYVNTNIFQVSDEIITLNADHSGVPSSNVGFEVNRGGSANVSFIWDETTDKWSYTNDGSTYLAVASNTDVSTAYSNATAYADAKAANAYSNATSYADTAAATAYSNAVSTASTDASTKAATAFSNAVANATNYSDTVAATAYSNAVSYADAKAANAYSNAVSYADAKAANAYSNAVAYAASNTYVNNTFAPKASPTFTGDVTVTGNLVVTGTTTFVNTNVFQISDEIITLNADHTGTPSADVGFEVNRGTSANTLLKWNEGTDTWVLTNDGTNYYNIATNTDVSTAYSNATSYADAKAANAYSNAVSYADTKAATAFSNAVANAASYSDTKAATAYSNAVSTAATDASTKAATAYSNAVSYADTKAAAAYTNAVAYAASNSYVNSTFAPLAGATFTGPVSFNANVTLGTTRLLANGATGTAGQVLTSGGSGSNVYWSTVTSGGGGGTGNTFSTIQVSGQSDVVADDPADALTFVGGNNVTITTNAGTDTITFESNNTLFTLTTVSNTSSANISLTGTGLTANTVKVIGAGGINVNSNGSVITIDGTNVAGGGGGGSTNSFGTIAVSGQSNVIADQANDTLTFVAGSGMSIATNASGDTITFTATGGGGGGTGGGNAFISGRDNFTANGTANTFTLSQSVTANNILVAVDGLIQFYNEDYEVTGTSLSFASAPANNELIEVIYISGASTYQFSQYAAIDTFTGDGSTTGYTLTRSANTSTAQVYLDGLLQAPTTDYTLSGTTLTFVTAPLTDEAVLVYHTETSDGNPHLTSIAGTDTFTGDDIETNFTLSATANSSTSFVTINGLVQRYTTDYTLSGTTLSFVTAPPSGSAIQAWRLTGSLGVTFKTISVSGQSDIVADLADDTLTFANGAGITITTNATTDTITIAQSTITKQSLTGNGSNTIFTLDTSTTEDNILVFVDGIYFHPTDDYSVSGTTLTFTTAPINSAEIRIRYIR